MGSSQRLSTTLRKHTRNVITAAALLLAAALPAVKPVPVYPSYSSYQPAYEPSYSYSPPAPSYDYSPPAYSYSPPDYYSPAPSYPSYSPAPYSPPDYYSPAPSYPSYSPPVYQPAPYYSPPAYSPPAYYPAPSYYPSPQYYQEYDNYDAITYQPLNASLHCGVIPATNDDLYGNSDVAPFGKYPFIVVIEDDYYNFVCQGVMLHWRYVLTAKSCIYGSADRYRVRFGDWDLLTNYNEYEAYKNFNTRICDAFPVSYDSNLMQYSYGGSDAELLLLVVDFPENVADKYPQVGSICLPQYYPSYSYPSYQPSYQPPAYPPPSYSPPAYPPPSYSPPAYPSYSPPAYPSYSPPAYPSYNPPAYPSYSPPAYTPPSYSPPSYYPSYTYPYSECYVVGWYGSPTTQLQNHPPPVEVQEQQSSYSYGYQPSYSPPSYKAAYYQEYYQYQDQSKIPRQATVKEIKCPAPSYGYGYNPPPPPPSYGYGYSSYQDEEVCFVGVYGSDACVADKGAAIFCLVPEHYTTGYDAGYTNYEQSYSYGYGYNPVPYTATYPSYEQSYYKKDITAAAAPPKPERKRAVLYAVVQEIATCQTQQYSYGYNQQQQSNPIRATKVTQQVVEAIVDNYWTHSYDKSCPAPKNYYPEPEIYYQASYSPPPYYSPPSYPEPSYYPAPSYPPPAYNPPPYYSPPAYEPSYAPPAYNPPPYYSPPSYPEPSYYPAPSYPSYSPPSYDSYSYSPPSYDSYQPSYQPSYSPPAYNPPPYYQG